MAAQIFLHVALLFLIHVDHLYASKYMRACFFNSDSRLRTNAAKFTVQDIDFSLCTHYIYGYGKIDSNRQTIRAPGGAEEDGPNGLFAEFNNGKMKNPGIKTILSVGGTQDSDNLEFVSLVEANIQTFPQKAIAYVKAQGFYGLNIHWATTDEHMGKVVLTGMLKSLRKVIDRDDIHSRLLLSITGHYNLDLINMNHNVPELAKYVDYVFVSGRHMISPQSASFISPLFAGVTDPFFININDSMHYWNQKGMPYNKLVMCVTALGHYVKLKSAIVFEPYSPATADVLRGRIYNLENMLAYPEICEMISTCQRYYDSGRKNPYLVKGDEWVGYIDPFSLQERAVYIKDLGLAGIEIGNLDEDDFSGKFCNAGKFPLVTFIRNALDPGSRTFSTFTTTTTRTTSTASAASSPSAELTPLAEVTDHHNGDNTATTTIDTPLQVSKEASSSPVFKYFLYILLFIIGHIVGHVCMHFFRNKSEATEQDVNINEVIADKKQRMSIYPQNKE